LNYKDLENLGYNIVIYPVTTQRLAMKSVWWLKCYYAGWTSKQHYR
jgi:2-methylisocitrate lyase-like PEP mutase family enzyme